VQIVRKQSEEKRTMDQRPRHRSINKGKKNARFALTSQETAKLARKLGRQLRGEDVLTGSSRPQLARKRSNVKLPRTKKGEETEMKY